jgi:lysosomal alpha-glucosidase
VFPDFTMNKTRSYWSKYIAKFHAQVPVDGLWLDMNEIVGFCDGECTSSTKSKNSAFDPNNPPYMPSGDFIYHRTLLMDSKDSLSMQYNTHSLYAHYENYATRIALDNLLKKRSLIITRSSFAGTGHTSSKWLGDNASTWEDLKNSISGILSMNLFGFPLIGGFFTPFNV